ncbi:hypothetical protein SELMODRAFT_404248 [Selaginella moellendorffii]|uniref:Uncharacterized protein n=1 Tax=Selaginella moellendorffii TaxID=88036 RepID=D8QUR2_SELML|nr:hypothetical protein SELMODRAFT_404248 [Selaginella moellendorffii]
MHESAPPEITGRKWLFLQAQCEFQVKRSATVTEVDAFNLTKKRMAVIAKQKMEKHGFIGKVLQKLYWLNVQTLWMNKGICKSYKKLLRPLQMPTCKRCVWLLSLESRIHADYVFLKLFRSVKLLAVLCMHSWLIKTILQVRMYSNIHMIVKEQI